VTGTYTALANTKYQGSDIGEKRYKASAGNDGGNTYVAEHSSGIVLNSGDDVFGLRAAGRINAVGCPMQRAAPANEHEERMGLTGIPDCTMYSHAKAADKPTGFVVKFNDNGDETQRGNKNSKFQKSITGFIKTSINGYATSIAPCTGTTNADGGNNKHGLTGDAACSTSPRGCSCLVLSVTSKVTGGTSAATSDSSLDAAIAVPVDPFNGMRIRITSGKAAGYEGIIHKYNVGVYSTIPALPAMPDENSQFTMQPWNNLQPNIHLATCSATKGMGCTAYGVEWAKTIGWPIGQAKVTPTNPTNVEAGVRGPWRTVSTATAPATNVTALQLNVADEVVTTTYYDGYWVELSTQTVAQAALDGSKAEAIARVTLYAIPTKKESGGTLTISCPDATACPVATRYRLISKASATTTTSGVQDLESAGTYQQSWPQSVSMMDSDVYIGGWFKGFDRFRFGIEGVDETVGFRSVGDDTWETYLVKLTD
jgi:hypothetical protein